MTSAKRLLRLSFTLIFVVPLLTGCVMPDQVSQIQKDLADVREQLAMIEREQTAAREALAEVRGTTGKQDTVSRAEFVDLDVRVDQTARDVEITDERIRDIARRLDRMSLDLDETKNMARGSADLAPSNPGSDSSVFVGGAVPAARKNTGVDPNELYNTAYADFSKGNYELAVEGFQEFYDSYSDNPVADNALYWIGECHFSQGDFASAIRAFDRMLEAFPDSDKAAAANLKKGLAYLEQNQVRQAIVQLQHVRRTYPGSDEAKVARDKLSSLGAPI